MSLVSLLNIARTALLTHQRAMNVTGNNVANAQTPGYSRQRLELVEAQPLWTPQGLIGRGVDADAVTRARDIFYDSTYRRENGLLQRASTHADILSQFESALGPPDQGLGKAMDDMFAAFTGLASDPAGGTPRTLARQSASALVDQFHQMAGRLQQLVDDGRGRMVDQVDRVNVLTRQIAATNSQIVAVGPNGAPALEDQRDLMLDELSQYMSMQVIKRDDGSIGIMTGGALVVDGGQSRDLVVRDTPSGPGVGFVLDSGTIDLGSGSLKSLVDLTNTTLPGYRAQLDLLASNLVSSFNAIHRSGYTLSGGTGVDFFDPSATSASTIRLSSAVLASTDAIAAGATPNPGDGANAAALGDLVHTPLPGLGNWSVRDYFINVTSDVGAAVNGAEQQVDVEQTLVDNADSQRQAVSGVSIDEEMVTLIAQQQAYTAATRLVTVANQIMDDLMNLVS